MTERLTALLHEEVADLQVPAAPSAAILAEGQRVRRRRRARAAVAGGIAAAVVTVAAATVVLRTHTPESVQPADREAYQERGAWAYDDEVHVGRHTVQVPGADRLYYTSVGALVGTRDGGFSLVRPTGAVERIDLDLPDTLTVRIATDPAAPYVAYVRALDAGTDQLVVRNLLTGREQPVGKPFADKPSGPSGVDWLWGDEIVYSHRGDGRTVNWRTGELMPFPPGTYESAKGLGAGVTVGFDSDADTWVVASATDGEVLLRVPGAQPTSTATASLSNDGRHLAVSGQDTAFTVYDVATGDSVTFEGRVLSGYGWTPDGRLVGKRYPLRDSEVEVCDPDTGACTGTGARRSHPLTLVPAPTGYAS